MSRMLCLLLLMVSIDSYSQKDSLPLLSYRLRMDITKNIFDSINVSISLRDVDAFLQTEKTFRILKVFVGNKLVVARVKKADLFFPIAAGNVLFINEHQTPKEELATGAYDLTLNTINYVHARRPDLNGSSLHAIVKERRFDTSDIDLKGRTLTIGVEAPTETAHASLMATIIAGAANTSPFAKGGATRAIVSSANFANLFPENNALLQQHNISIENHSYGTVVENFYGNEARAYDLQSNALPALLHVFSSGNSGNVTETTGPYAGITQFANLTGNFKHSKNSIAVGSVDSAGQLMPLSSRGPAFDGRVKPEMVAYGEDGSSGAAATVSAAALLVQDVYKKNNNRIPSSSLVKAVLLNSAKDIGNPHVDYHSGFGNLDVYQAVNTITQNHFFESSAGVNDVKVFNINLPAGIKRLKLMLVWNDPAAAAGAAKALVNDLDLVLQLPATNETWLPWVLDPSANIAAVQAAAQRKTDTLNNVEQITVDDPSAGTYRLEVRGSRVTGLSQDFAIAYQMDTADVFYFTYPTLNDPLIAGNTHWIRWATERTGPAQIEYTTNNSNWRTVASLPDVALNYYKWKLPDTVTTAVLRMKMLSDGATITSDTFTISPQLSMQVGFNCADSFLLYWNSTPANRYSVYELNGNFLQTVREQNDTFLLLNKQLHPSVYYAVAPVISGKPGIRSNTINYLSAGPECYIKTFFLQSQTPDLAVFTAELGTLFGVAEVALEKAAGNAFITISVVPLPQTLHFRFDGPFLHQGENRYRLRVTLTNGQVLYSNIETVYHFPSAAVIIYPNPVAQHSSLQILSNESGRYTLQLFDVNGRLVFTQLLTSTVTKLNSGLLAKGLYVARIVDGKGGVFTQKIVVY